MKFTNDQFEALVYIFEIQNGNKKSDYENKCIEESGLKNFEPELLEKKIVEGLENGIYDNSIERVSAYWALGKRFNRNLIPLFQKWLKKEFDINDSLAVYQLLISLGNMEEQVFNPNRNGGSAYYETELNMKDAKDYLNKNIRNSV